MASLDAFRSLLASETGLVTVTSLRADGGPLSSVVNAGVVDHPVSGAAVVGLVARGDAARLGHLRRDPRINIVVRRGWQWAAVEGETDLIGPDDRPSADVDLAKLCRDIFVAAGGEHDDWTEYDRAMRDERRCCVLVSPRRVYSNPGSS